MPDASTVTFPSGFLWGAATSSHQVEGNNTLNDWWAWEQAGKTTEKSGLACDQYRRFRDDFDLAKELGQTAHRLSLEWSRIEPREGEFDGAAIAHYQDVIRALRERGLEPLVTLHHYTNPQWLARQGGWVNPTVVERFARYVRHAVEALGPDVRYWMTINEPLVYAAMHYIDGVGPPGEHHLGHAFTVMEHMLRAHVAAYDAIHAVARARGGQGVSVGLANHAQPFVPCRRWWWPDRFIARLTTEVYNHRYWDAMMDGVWKVPGKRPIRITDHPAMDFIGLNYYGRIFMRLGIPTGRQWAGVRCSTRHHREVTERNALDWDVYPPGIAEVIGWGAKYRKPVLITENGLCTADDAQRERFILNHLRWVARAIQDGAQVMGYLYWSLVDNFEWAMGYGPRFGLIEVDYATQARRVRPSARRFADVCRTNQLEMSGGR